MDPERQEAYRHLLYAALVELRRGPAPLVWWNPKSWSRKFSELQRTKDLANCFHNLAFFSVRHFERFDEARFWDDIEHLGRKQGSEISKRYRGIFDAYFAGRSART